LVSASIAVQVQIFQAALGRGFHAGDVLLLRATEGPKLVNLHPLGLHAAHQPVMRLNARLPGFYQQLSHGVDAHVFDAADGPRGSSLAHEAEDLGALGARELVHAGAYVSFST